jgi:hypothetical protein
MSLHHHVPPQPARDTGMSLPLEAADARDRSATASESPEEAARFSALAQRAHKDVAPTATRPPTDEEMYGSPPPASVVVSQRSVVIAPHSYAHLLTALDEAQTAALAVRDLGPTAYERPRNNRVEPALVHAEAKCETALTEIRTMLDSIWLTL